MAEMTTVQPQAPAPAPAPAQGKPPLKKKGAQKKKMAKRLIVLAVAAAVCLGGGFALHRFLNSGSGDLGEIYAQPASIGSIQSTVSGSGTAKDPERTTHIRIPASVCTAGYLPYAQWMALSAAEKAKHWTLKRGWKLVQGAVPALTEAEYAKLEKTHLCCTAAAVSDDREPLLPHWHVEGS